MSTPSPSPDGRGRRSGVTRERLLDAAAWLLCRKGFSGATLDAIGTRARANKALVAYHFGSKTGLYRAAVARPLDELLAELARIPADQTPDRRLRLFVEAFASVCRRHRLLASFILQEPVAASSEVGAAVRSRMKEIYSSLADVMASGQRQGVFKETNPLVVHMCIVGSLSFYYASEAVLEKAVKDGLLQQGCVVGSSDYTDGLIELLLDGLCDRAKKRKKG
jgi:AcrR family transcriptional regulator